MKESGIPRDIYSLINLQGRRFRVKAGMWLSVDKAVFTEKKIDQPQDVKLTE